jgi:hypothetical protein
MKMANSTAFHNHITPIDNAGRQLLLHIRLVGWHVERK